MIKLKKRFILPVSFLLLILVLVTMYACVDDHIGAQPHPVVCDESTFMHYSDTTEVKSVEYIVDINCLLSGCHGENPNIPNWSQLDELQDHKEEIQRRITLPDTDPD